MKQIIWVAGLAVAIAACKTGSSAKVRADGDEAPGEPQNGETEEAAPLSPNAFTAMDVGIVFPARDKADFDNLLKLSDAPPAGNGFGTRGDGAIIDRATFQTFVGKGAVMANTIDAIPDYSRWRIVAVRPLLCARIKTAEDLAASGAYPARCQVEHRLVAQPLNDAGNGFLDFSLHVISRPFNPGAPQNVELATHIVSNLSQIKARAGANDSNGKGFAAYPALVARDARVNGMIKDHVLRFYGGKFLRTLAFMGSKNDNSWLFFSGSSGGNGLSSLIRPGRDSTFQTVQESGNATTVNFFDTAGTSLTPGRRPTVDATAGSGTTFPTISALLAGQATAAAATQAAVVENIKQTILSDTDCASCHHVTAAAQVLNLRAQINGSVGVFPFLSKQPVAPGTLQSRKEMFVNLGYFTPAGSSGALLSISQEAINDATQQAVFVNALKGVLIKPNVELTTETALAPTAGQITPVDAPDFELDPSKL